MPKTMPRVAARRAPRSASVPAVRREQVYADLQQAILTHRFTPGQRLIERELMEEFGVSRATVREAIRELAAAGLATVLPQQGARVTTASAADARDLYALRSSLEVMIIERFIEHASDALVEELVAAVVELGRVAQSGVDPNTIMKVRDLFYDVLFAGAGTPIIEQEARGIQARVRVLCASSLSETGRSEAAAHELAAVVDAIGARNAPRATTLMRSHLELAAAATLRTLTPGTDPKSA